MSIVILDGTRTPFGKWKGALSPFSAKDLATHTLTNLLERTPEAKEADGVLLAQVIQAGQGQNPARQVAARSGIDLKTPAITLNNVCLGGLATIADSFRRITLGEGELYVVGGFDSMTNAPHTLPVRSENGFGHIEATDTLLHDGLWCSLTNQSMGLLTDQVNRDHGIDRPSQDRYAAQSQQRAAKAQQQGNLKAEITPIPDYLDEDEGIRPRTTEEKLAKLSPAFSEDGTITAGNASQMTDGASLGIVTTSEKAQALGHTPLAEVVDWSEIACRMKACRRNRPVPSASFYRNMN